MSQIIPIYIPTYISDQNYNPSRVLPRLLFYNGMVDSQKWYIESGSTTVGGTAFEQNAFPYFDNYNVVSGSFPTTDSDSLLFFNEQAVYGQTPTDSLYTNYWQTYVELLYNPRTRLINASAIIPLADYFKMELNDIVQWRGNYYHLRAINDYNLKNGECQIQLLGPILPDALPFANPVTTTTTAPATVKIHVEEYNASPTAFFDLNVFANGQSYFFSGDFSQSVAPNTSIVEMEVAQNSPSQIWGPYLTASATMTITDNGSNIFNNTSIYTSGSATYSVTSSVNFQSGHTYIISASNQPYVTASCCTPTITSASISGADISIFFTTASECSGCTATTIEKSVDGSTWHGSNTAGCTSPRVIAAPTSSIYYRMYETCGAATSSFSNSYYFVSGSGTATLSWSYTETGGAVGNMDIYINGTSTIVSSTTGAGTRTVNVGDEIRLELTCNQCGNPDNYSNAWCTGIIDDADCTQNGIAGILTAVYTVQIADIGDTLILDTFAACAGGCL